MSEGDGDRGGDSTDGERSFSDDDLERVDGHEALVEGVLAGDDRSLARTISLIEDGAPGARGLAAALYHHAGDAHVIGVTGSPGTGKSTLVNRLAAALRDAGHDVGVVAIDPASPFSGGAVLGDRLRMSASRGADGVFVRSMSARGHLGGLSTATTDAIVAMDAAGKDTVIVETVGAGQNEVEIVRTADTVAVILTPGAGDAIQTLKAGILEIGDIFVVNKADHDGADRTVADLRGMLEERRAAASHPRGPDGDEASGDRQDAPAATSWSPPIVETVATEGVGIDDLQTALAEHLAHLRDAGELATRRRARQAAQLRRICRADAAEMVEDAISHQGGMDALEERLQDGEDPYGVAADVLQTVLEDGVGAPAGTGADRDE